MYSNLPARVYVFDLDGTLYHKPAKGYKKFLKERGLNVELSAGEVLAKALVGLHNRVNEGFKEGILDVRKAFFKSLVAKVREKNGGRLAERLPQHTIEKFTKLDGILSVLTHGHGEIYAEPVLEEMGVLQFFKPEINENYVYDIADICREDGDRLDTKDKMECWRKWLAAFMDDSEYKFEFNEIVVIDDRAKALKAAKEFEAFLLAEGVEINVRTVLVGKTKEQAKAKHQPFVDEAYATLDDFFTAELQKQKGFEA